MVLEGCMWLSASGNIIPSVSTKPFMGLRGPDVATSITAGPSASGARPRIPWEAKSILGVLLQLDNVFLHSGFNTPHIIGYIWWYFGTSNVAFVDVYRMCAVSRYRNMVYLKESGYDLSNVPERKAVKYDGLIGRDVESWSSLRSDTRC
eukprot:CAMPEP_0198201724 /NCGR_PEP_ID=MMETSP1445-20131203/4706_1 /TAXON_ID=36898 /ORGANISM="Pyramimonas sp., Strain CCMP2087" /LENGTH=148 /DNA_ID=CAMNT_0043872287 /DNA_START=286 /DNA_END=732 /DNA_ORIENTATION=-